MVVCICNRTTMPRISLAIPLHSMDFKSKNGHNGTLCCIRKTMMTNAFNFEMCCGYFDALMKIYFVFAKVVADTKYAFELYHLTFAISNSSMNLENSYCMCCSNFVAFWKQNMVKMGKKNIKSYALLMGLCKFQQHRLC